MDQLNYDQGECPAARERTGPAAHVLELLSVHPSLTRKELARMTMVPHTTLHKTLDYLESDFLVHKLVDPNSTSHNPSYCWTLRSPN